jgi:sortase A
MTAYRYVKAKPKEIKKGLRLLPVVLLIGGVVFLANAAMPILLYQLRDKTKFEVLGEESLLDYTKPSSWFPTAPRLPDRPSKISHYTLTIDKLKIKEAVVEIGGDDIMENLVHYAGTALPGQYGNVVIFGHSALPQFYSPKNYRTIFATLPTIKIGDEIEVSFDGVIYHYQVIELVEVEPTDISVLAQYYDDKYLSLVTCVPPGTYLRRLVVRARLI